MSSAVHPALGHSPFRAPSKTRILYLCPPAAARAALAGYLGSGIPGTQESAPGVFAVPLGTERLAGLAADLPGVLTEPEVRGTRAVVAPIGAAPTAADLMHAQSLAALLAPLRHRWLMGVLREDRLVTHFQPIVRPADPAEVFGYECLVRGVRPDGQLVPPRDLFAAARASDLLVPLDRQARLTAIRAAARLAAPTRLFVNFSPSSLYVPGFCLRTTGRAVAAAGLTPGRVVFEVVETEKVRDVGHLVRALGQYRAAGFRVALDDVGAGYNSLTLLTRLRPDFVKLDMGLTRGVDRDPYKARVVFTLLGMARDLGIRTVVEGVETVGEWEWATASGADFVQGYLFARPAAVPPRPARPTG
jgi:EAL domain-containing protein (putative c-di-GMP-specific phosphodiesterase class I)